MVVKVDIKNTNYTLNNLGTLKCSELTLASSTTADGGGHHSTPKRFSLAAHLSALKCSELASTDFNPFYSKSIAHCSERLKCS